MEALGAAWEALTDWWAGLPGIPDLDLPPPGDTDVMLVVATVLLALGLVGFINGWVDQRVSWAGVFASLLAVALFFWTWEADRASITWISVPEAFVEMVARVLR